MRIECLSATDVRWRDLLNEVAHDVYHLPEYLELTGRFEGGRPTAFLATEGDYFCLIPVLLRPLPRVLEAPSDWQDATSPYGYAAPLFRGNDHWTRRVTAAFSAVCHEHNVVSAFIRTHPLLPVPTECHSSWQPVLHGETVYVDLTLDETDLWRQTRPRMRSYIKHLQREGFRAVFDDWSSFQTFSGIYLQTMGRLQANPFYHLPPEYFTELRAALASRLHYCSVWSPDGTLACGAILTETRGVVQYHLSGTSDAHLKHSPSKLMVHEIRSWARSRGCRVLHLGGGFGGRSDALFQFKAGFSPLRSKYFTYRVIADNQKYTALCSRARLGEATPQDRFPRYRSPA